MPRSKKRPTKQIRVYADVANLAQRLAGVFDQDVSDFLDTLLRDFLEKKRQEAMRVLDKSKPKNGS